MQFRLSATYVPAQQPELAGSVEHEVVSRVSSILVARIPLMKTVLPDSNVQSVDVLR
jgi:hypothetical protein